MIKKQVCYKSNQLCDFVAELKQASDEQEREIERAVIGRGKYRFRKSVNYHFTFSLLDICSRTLGHTINLQITQWKCVTTVNCCCTLEVCVCVHAYVHVFTCVCMLL